MHRLFFWTLKWIIGASIAFAYCSCNCFVGLVISPTVFYFSSCSNKVIFLISHAFLGQVISIPQIFKRPIKIYSKSTTTWLESFLGKRYFFLMSNETFFCNINLQRCKNNKDAKLTKMLISTTKHNFRLENLTFRKVVLGKIWDRMF